jgi:hypothetical protein
LYGREVITKASRLRVGFRLILAIPHIIGVVVMAVVLVFVGIVGWFAALFMGRLPTGLHSYITGIIRYQTRVFCYLALLTDQYPPFALRAVPEYAVQFQTSEERLNRLAVLFRIILAIPAYVLNAFVTTGAEIVLIVTWFITVIGGRVPEPLFDALAGAQRYMARFNSYFWLVTPAYPAGLFNDSQATPPEYVEQAASPWEAPQLQPPRQTAGAKRLLVVFLVLGIIGSGTRAAFDPNPFSEASHVHNLNKLRHAHNTVTTAVQLAPCPTTDPTAQLTCLRGNAHSDAAAFTEFGDTLDGLHFSSNANAEKTQLEETTDSLVQAFGALAAAQTPLQFNQLAASQNVEALLTQWDSNYKALDDQVAS